MRYTIFGRRTGLRVSELALGAGNFGTGWGYGAEPRDARLILERFAAAGGNFIDTADSYQFGQSEELVGEFIRSDRDCAWSRRRAVVALARRVPDRKVSPRRGKAGQRPRRRHLATDCRAVLLRLLQHLV